MNWNIPPLFPVKGVIFDMDGLMLDTERMIQYSWEVTGGELGYSNFGSNILHFGHEPDPEKSIFSGKIRGGFSAAAVYRPLS